ncbi:MAG: Tol-Pal system beta propeller repeat protein TolB [Desulfatirhabdiaceae bacterium]
MGNSAVRLKIIGMLLILLLTGETAWCAGKYDYIDISNPMMKKIPIAVPLFKPVSGNTAEIQTADSGSKQLSNFLGFTGYFKVIDRGAFLIDTAQSDVAIPQYKAWTTVGAEFLVTGAAASQDNQLELELRLFDTINQRQLIGKKYTGHPDDQRKMIRRFCSEIMMLLIGNSGIFDSQITFVSTTGSGNKEIFIAEFDGSDARQITSNKSINLSPAMSSDGKYIAYTSYAGGKPDLYIQSLSDRKISVVDKKGMAISPAWVPGRFELAASLSFSGDPEIYLLTGNGKIINKISESSGIDLSPSFSPDGKKMAFVSRRAGSPQIYIQDIGSGKVDRITFYGNNNTQPEWSPKGDKIVYTSLEKNVFNIVVTGVNGNGAVQLTHGSGDNESPSWSPDGSMIVFSSTREGVSKIYVMTAFGTDQRRLVDLSGQQSEPKWSPNVTN